MGNYPTLHQVVAMNGQTMFDHIARHLLRQGRPCRLRSGDDSAPCLYRRDDDTACAVGSIIPEALYRPDMEGRELCRLIGYLDESGDTDRWLLGRTMKHHYRLLDALQSLHDGQPEYQWPGALGNIARDIGLSPKAVHDTLREQHTGRVRELHGKPVSMPGGPGPRELEVENVVG